MLSLTSAGEVLIRSDVHRVQDQNKSACLEKLDKMISKAFFIPKKRVKTKPTYSSTLKRQEAKKRRGDIKSGRKKVSHNE
jgi:ribosome-associated protein